MSKPASSNMIRQMVDNILRDSEEVGYGSDADDPDLSGDEVKTPIFVIKRDNEESKEANQMVDEMDGDDRSEEDDLFV